LSVKNNICTFTHLDPNDDLLHLDKSLPADVHTTEAAAHAALLPFEQVISQPDCKLFAVVFLYTEFAVEFIDFVPSMHDAASTFFK
jgi:hypothetical protein